jgi:peptide/nickel transport system permease protein
VQIMLGMQTSPEAAAAMRAEFNLDKPLPEQYALWVAKVATGDLGRSIRLNDRVTTLLAERLPISLQLAGAAMLFALLVSIPLGVTAALKRNTWIDYLCTGYTVLGFAVPNFGLALILIWLFSIKLDWLPITGIGSAEAAAGGWWAYVSPFIVPAIALGTLQTAILTRLLRSSMIDVLSQDYMRTARAKGLLPVTIVVVHALKNAMIPFVTMAAVQFGYMIGIQVTIEYIFAVPGMGSAVLNAVVNRDFPVIQGFTLVIALFFLFANIVADMLYALFDPRIRY